MKELVRVAIADTLAALFEAEALLPCDMPRFSVDAPKKAEHGDFATNAAMMLAKPQKKKPRDIAEVIADGLRKRSDLFVDVDIAGPGFINMRLQDAVFHDVIRQVLAAGDAWGTTPSTNKRVLVEFVSANPTGPLHLGHARGAFFGDAVSRLLEAAGHDVTREFYINDFGAQVETLGRSVHARYRELFGEKIELKAGEYPAPYVIELAKALRDEDGDIWLDKSESEWLGRCIEVGIRENLANIRTALEKCDICFDSWASEAALHESGFVVETAKKFVDMGVTYEAEKARGTDDKVRREGSKAAQFANLQKGGTFLGTSRFGDEEDRVILRADGTPVYLTADLAYHRQKFERGFDRMIDVFGADHSGHIPRIKAGMQALGFDVDKLSFLAVQMVRLMRGGEEVRISKRTGQLYELAELIDEVGADVVRFVFLLRSANAQFDFDLDELRAKSHDNPVYYCQYGHARCVNVLRKAEEKDTPFRGTDGLSDEVLSCLTLPEEKALLLKMSELPGVVQGAAEALEPHRLLYFARDLIGEFHGYFGKYKNTARIVSDDDRTTQARLGLVAALRQTIACALQLLGITAPEWMDAPPNDDTEPAH